MNRPEEMRNLEPLLDELRRLNRGEKLRVMQVLVAALAAEEEALVKHGTHYEVWSPYHAGSAADTLLAMLAAEQDTPNG